MRTARRIDRRRLLYRVAVMLFLCTGAGLAAPADSPEGVAIALIGYEQTAAMLELHYEISNSTDHDVWLCDNIWVPWSPPLETFLDADGQTLVVRRRFGVPQEIRWDASPEQRYVRLPAGHVRRESTVLPLPVQDCRLYGDEKPMGDAVTTRLLLEIGYWPEDVLGAVRNLLLQPTDNPPADLDVPCFVEAFGGLLNLSYWQEGAVRNRQEELEVFYEYACTKNEQILTVELDGVSIPYRQSATLNVMGQPVGDCTRIEIRYEPSMLAYFFGDEKEQNLLSETEREYLQSLRTIEVTDEDEIWALAGSLSGDYGPVTFTDAASAEVVGYRDGEQLFSLTAYRRALITADRQPFYRDEGFAALREITPQIRPFEKRMQCADNLDDWWYRFRLYHLIRRAQTDYLVASQWCDDMATALRTAGWRDH